MERYMKFNDKVTDAQAERFSKELERLSKKYGGSVFLSMEYGPNDFDERLTNAVRKFEIMNA